MRHRWFALLVLLPLLLGGCSAASRALVHQEDRSKVFPWPASSDTVTIRVKPLTTSASWFKTGGWESVEVSREETFFITDETGKQFAYTPRLSPIRRLAPVDSMEIVWPPKTGRVATPAPADGGVGDSAAPPPDGSGPPAPPAPPEPSGS